MDTQKHTNLTGKRNDEVAPVRLDRDALAAYPENSVLQAESPRGCRTFEGGHKGENMQFIDAIEGLAQDDALAIAERHDSKGQLCGVDVDRREVTCHWEDAMRGRAHLRHIANEIFHDIEAVDQVVHRIPVNVDWGWVITYDRDGTCRQQRDIKPLPLFKAHGVLV